MGRSYSEWIESWSNLLVSDSPDYQSGNEMLFLRGSIDYKTDSSGVRSKEPGKFFDKTGNLGETIYENTALFIPIISALYTINETYEGRPLLDEEGLRYAVRKDIAEGGDMWLRVKSDKDPKYKPIVALTDKNDINNDFYFETAKFTLNVSRNSPLVAQFEYPYPPNNYEAVQGGYFVILYDLDPGIYRFNFGGFGRGSYYSAGVYDITVLKGNTRNLVKDVSKENLPEEKENDKENQKILTLNKAKVFHLKIEDDIEKSSPFNLKC